MATETGCCAIAVISAVSEPAGTSVNAVIVATEGTVRHVSSFSSNGYDASEPRPLLSMMYCGRWGEFVQCPQRRPCGACTWGGKPLGAAQLADVVQQAPPTGVGKWFCVVRIPGTCAHLERIVHQAAVAGLISLAVRAVH